MTDGWRDAETPGPEPRGRRGADGRHAAHAPAQGLNGRHGDTQKDERMPDVVGDGCPANDGRTDGETGDGEWREDGLQAVPCGREARPPLSSQRGPLRDGAGSDAELVAGRPSPKPHQCSRGTTSVWVPVPSPLSPAGPSTAPWPWEAPPGPGRPLDWSGACSEALVLSDALAWMTVPLARAQSLSQRPADEDLATCSQGPGREGQADLLVHTSSLADLARALLTTLEALRCALGLDLPCTGTQL